MSAPKHTIILVQYNQSYQSRSYMDFPTVTGAIDAVIKMYEHKLKELNPAIKNITYDINDLYVFLDSLYDISFLVFDPQSNKYDPRDKNWAKRIIFDQLRSQSKN